MISAVKVNTFLLLALAGSVALNWTGALDTSRPNFEYMPNMAHSARYNAFSSNPNFADGKTLQEPVPGTVPRGFRPLHYQATPQDALRAGEELHNPLASTDLRALNRGAFVFANFCQVCHGVEGIGNGPVAMRGFPAPPSLLADHALKMKDGQMFHVLTYGQKNMPPYRTQVLEEDRWRVILFIRSLQKQAQAAPQPGIWPPSPAPTGPEAGTQPPLQVQPANPSTGEKR